MQYRLAIIIVNFRTPALTADCLRSLAPEVEANPGTRVFVVENGSGDDSAVKLRASIEAAGWESWCTLVVSEKNWGFAGGNNRGVERMAADGGAEYVLLLNSDTIVHPGCIRHTLDVMAREPRIGALSCRLSNADGTVQNTCRKFPTPLRCIVGALGLTWSIPRLFGWANGEDPGWDRATTKRDVEWIGGAFVMVRGNWIAKHGPLDESFFFYGEDIEFSHRVWRTGYRVHYDPAVAVTHLGGSSSDPTKMTDAAKNIHSCRGRYLVQRKCWGRWAEWLVRGVDITNCWARGLLHRVRSGKTSPDYLKYRDALKLLTGSLKA